MAAKEGTKSNKTRHYCSSQKKWQRMEGKLKVHSQKNKSLIFDADRNNYLRAAGKNHKLVNTDSS